MFTADELADLQAFSESAMPHTMAVQAGTPTQGGAGTTGGVTLGWATVPGLGAVPCRLSPDRAAQAAVTAGAEMQLRRYRVACPVDTPVDWGQPRRVVVSHALPGVPNPLTLRVLGVDVQTYEMHRSLRTEVAG